MTGATLMYGIGATKAGTSWLYRYLAAHPDCAMPTPKELHFFDTLEFGPRKLQQKMLARRIAEGDEDQKAQLTRWLGILESGDAAAYLDYLTANAGEAKLVGDITPAYALLPEQRLTAMAALAPVTRFVYILRDPVERLWSNIRMAAGRKAKGEAQRERIAHRLAERVLAGEDHEVMKRSDYAGALKRLDRALDVKTLFVGFYETLFSAETMARLCDFLGISFRDGDYSKRIHGGQRLPMGEALSDRFARLLAPQYAAVEARFGSLPEAWQNNMVKV